MADQPAKSLRLLFKGLCLILALALAAVAWRVIHNLRGRDFDPARSALQRQRVEVSRDPSELPNIVIVLADDLGHGDLSGPGVGLIRTPQLDRLADDGVSLSNFCAAAPVCTPSRTALLTGRYPIRTHLTLPLYPTGHPAGLALNAIGRYPYGVTGIPEDELLLPELLSRRGYRTALVGKWHLGDQVHHLPNDRGFGFYYGALYSNDVTPFAVYRNDKIEIPAPAPQEFLTRDYTREAVRFIQEQGKSPFFLLLAHTMVHEPLHASPEFRGRSGAGLYGDALEEIDWSVGEILRTLREQGLEEKTLLVFTSDNGPWWQGSSGGLRGRKNNLMEGGFRVPFLARWPGVLPAGAVRDGLAVNFDLFTTCLLAAGIPLPDDRIIDGRDLMPLLQGKAASSQDTFYYYFGHELGAVRSGDWKYHRRAMSDNGGYPIFRHGPFLFHLDRDPTESYSLIESEPERASRLSRMLDEWEAGIAANRRGWHR